MSISLCVSGITPPDTEYYKMKAIWDSCTIAGIDIPEKVVEFFDYREPDEKGVMFELDDTVISAISDNHEHGYDIELSKINKNIRFIRVTLC